MLFPTVNFAIFFTVVLGVFWLARPYRLAWRIFLLGASYFFYAAWEARFLALLVGMTLANWLIARAIALGRSRRASFGGGLPPHNGHDPDGHLGPASIHGVAQEAAPALSAPATILAPGHSIAGLELGMALLEAAGGSAPLALEHERATGDPPTHFGTNGNGHAPTSVLPVVFPVAAPARPWWLPLTDQRFLIALAVVVDLAVLGWFKYEGFFASSLVNLFASLGWDLPLPLVQVTLPIGVSFFTFQAISYVVDVGRGKYHSMPLLDFATYIAFFPHLVAGPIVRAAEFGPQMDLPANRSAIEAAPAFTLIVTGLFKKVVIANYLATELVDPVFAVPGQHSGLEILAAIYGYAIQIFADFSGYTDIAIGCALLLGFRLPKNFDSPYRSLSLQEFWRRWHMTLSFWLRDYLYIPLGGSRKGKWLTKRNLFITFLLGGLWHGAAWTFVVWGAIHGAWLSLESWLGFRGSANRWWSAVRWLVIFHVVCLGWVFFRAESIESAGEIIQRLFTAGGSISLVTPAIVLIIAGSLVAQFAPGHWLEKAQVNFGRLGLVPQAAALGLCLVLIDGLGPSGVAPFIYFQF